LLAETYANEIEAILAKYPNRLSAVMPLMYLAQEHYGYMSQEAMDDVANVLDIPATHVLSLAGFYSLYYENPVGKFVLEVCNDLPCALRGADDFLEMASRKLGIPVEGTTSDGLFTLKAVMCLAACDKAPMLQCNLCYEENLDEAKFDALIARLRAEAAAGSYEGEARRAVPPEAQGLAAPSAETAEADNLELIEGIGPKVAALLRAAGIGSFRELAGAAAERLRTILGESHLQMADPTSWPEQARLALAGDTASLALYQSKLRAGRQVGEPDDLEIIEGVGPRVAGLLRAAGIVSFGDLAGAPLERLHHILEENHLQMVDPASWAEQARLAATGDREALAQYQSLLKGGRAVTDAPQPE
jgi:NADH-quinone oxidoreductase subunit E